MARVLKNSDSQGVCRRDVVDLLAAMHENPELTVDANMHNAPHVVAAELDDYGGETAPHQPEASDMSVERLQHVLHELICAFLRQREALLLDLKPVLLQMIHGVVTRVVRAETRINREVAVHCVDAILQELSMNGCVIAKVSPEDAATVQAASQNGELTSSTLLTLDVVADNSILPGGCILETDYGQIDATIQTRFAELERILGADCSKC